MYLSRQVRSGSGSDEIIKSQGHNPATAFFLHEVRTLQVGSGDSGIPVLPSCGSVGQCLSPLLLSDLSLQTGIVSPCMVIHRPPVYITGGTVGQS